MTEVIDLRALTDEDPSAQLEVQIGDEFRFRDITQRFALPFFAPLELNWGHEVFTDLVERLRDLGLRVEQRGLYDVIRDEVGLGVTYRMQLVVFRVVGFEDELIDVAQVPGAEPQVVEASALRVAVILASSVVAVALAITAANITSIELVRELPKEAIVKAAGGLQLVGLALAIGAGAWLLSEARR